VANFLGMIKDEGLAFGSGKRVKSFLFLCGQSQPFETRLEALDQSGDNRMAFTVIIFVCRCLDVPKNV
jgi:hypothetical protein